MLPAVHFVHKATRFWQNGGQNQEILVPKVRAEEKATLFKGWPLKDVLETSAPADAASAYAGLWSRLQQKHLHSARVWGGEDSLEYR